MWGEREEEVILTIVNHRGSNAEDRGQPHPEAPTPALAPSTMPGLVSVGRSWEGECPGEGSGCQAAGFESTFVFRQPVRTCR